MSFSNTNMSCDNILFGNGGKANLTTNLRAGGAIDFKEGEVYMTGMSGTGGVVGIDASGLLHKVAGGGGGQSGNVFLEGAGGTKVNDYGTTVSNIFRGALQFQTVSNHPATDVPTLPLASSLLATDVNGIVAKHTNIPETAVVGLVNNLADKLSMVETSAQQVVSPLTFTGISGTGTLLGIDSNGVLSKVNAPITGGIDSVNITNAGLYWNAGDTGPCTTNTGNGSGAFFEVASTVPAAGGATAVIVSVNFPTIGSGYSVGDTITLTNINIGGTDATATITTVGSPPAGDAFLAGGISTNVPQEFTGFNKFTELTSVEGGIVNSVLVEAVGNNTYAKIGHANTGIADIQLSGHYGTASTPNNPHCTTTLTWTGNYVDNVAVSALRVGFQANLGSPAQGVALGLIEANPNIYLPTDDDVYDCVWTPSDIAGFWQLRRGNVVQAGGDAFLGSGTTASPQTFTGVNHFTDPVTLGDSTVTTQANLNFENSLGSDGLFMDSDVLGLQVEHRLTSKNLHTLKSQSAHGLYIKQTGGAEIEIASNTRFEDWAVIPITTGNYISVVGDELSYRREITKQFNTTIGSPDKYFTKTFLRGSVERVAVSTGAIDQIVDLNTLIIATPSPVSRQFGTYYAPATGSTQPASTEQYLPFTCLIGSPPGVLNGGLNIQISVNTFNKTPNIGYNQSAVAPETDDGFITVGCKYSFDGIYWDNIA